MAKYAKNVVTLAQSWVGKKESDGTHKSIIDIYNTYKPHPRGYKMTYTDPWCATFVSAIAIKLGYTSIMPVECSCNKMIELYKKLGCWVENENRTPKSGDIIFYDWEDNGTGDNKGVSDHVGIVEKVANNKITIIEGNYSHAVKRRTLNVNGRYIRGYAIPKYDAVPVVTQPTTSTIKKGDLVSIKSGAKYYNGKAVPSWVVGQKWYVDEVVGDRAIINKNEQGTSAINSPINVLYLTVAKSTTPTIKVGSTVKIKQGAKTYTGGKLASFVYTRKYKVKELKGDRAVVTYLGITVAAVNVKDLVLV